MNSRMSNLTLSALERPQLLQQLQDHKYDLLVIGGGITGAGIALDAITRGMTVALIEKHDFAWGTSSRSTKLIHGGLRYLKQFEVNLVREVGRERAILHRNAPHIVHPENMLLPIIKQGSLGQTSTSVGLYVYDWLAGVKRSERRVMLTKQQTLKREPLLKEDILLGGGLYKEYRTDDARLVIEVMKTARKFGADITNYVKAEKFLYKNEKATGVEVTDEQTGKTFQINAATIVNAAGPWVDELRRLDGSMNGKHLHLTKGVHIVVPYEKLPLHESVYFDVEDGRMIFAIPRDKVTYIGTTDTNYKEEPDGPVATAEDVNYLLKAVNKVFPKVGLELDNVISSWAGVRPLIHEEGKDPSELSRKDELFFSKSGIISIAGGKLTGFRKMAERTVDEVVKHLRHQGRHGFKSCKTDKITLSGGEFKNLGELNAMIDKVAERTGLERVDARILVFKYGSNVEGILNDAETKGVSLIEAELDYALANEMVQHPADFLIRRTGRLYFEPVTVLQLLPTVLQRFQATFSLTDQKVEQYEQEVQSAIDMTLAFQKKRPVN